MNIQALLNELSAVTGIDDLRLDENGQCSLKFDNEHEVTFAEDAEDQALLLYAPLGLKSDFWEAETLKQLLTDSFLGSATAGAAFGINPQDGTLYLWKRFNGEFADFGLFEQAINGFLGQVVFWKAKFGGSAQPEAGADSSGTPNLPFNAFSPFGGLSV